MQFELGSNLRDAARQRLYHECDETMRTGLGESVSDSNRGRLEALLLLLGACYGISSDRMTFHKHFVGCLMPDPGRGGKRLWSYDPARVVKGIRRCPAVLPYFPTIGLLRELIETGDVLYAPKAINTKATVPAEAEELAKQWEAEDGLSNRQTPAEVGEKRMRAIINLLSRVKTIEEATAPRSRGATAPSSRSSAPSETAGASTTTAATAGSEPSISTAAKAPNTAPPDGEPTTLRADDDDQPEEWYQR